jgi:antitoxin component of RelBE/YafQ-DinJ toxin-antitoxin module
MPRNDLFTMRVNEADKRELKAVAEKMQRTQADAVRVLVREKARELATDAELEVRSDSDRD